MDKRQELLKKYKTISKMKELTVEDLSSILLETVASNLVEFLKNY